VAPETRGRVGGPGAGRRAPGRGGARGQAEEGGLAARASPGADPGPPVALDDPDHLAPPVVVAAPGVPQGPVRPEPAPAFRRGHQVPMTRRGPPRAPPPSGPLLPPAPPTPPAPPQHARP